MRQESINKKFEIVTNLVSEYYISNEKNHTTNFNKDLCSEILARINKLRYLFERIYSLERQSENFNDVIFQTIKNGNFKENMFREESITIHDPMMMELEILTECFYHIAWRVVDVLKNGRLHGITIKSIKGISDVRNHLIQHPEKHGEILINSFGYGGSNGPVIKAARYSEQINLSPDKGLYSNLEELLDEVIKKLKNAK